MNEILIITNADMSLQSGNVVLIIRRAQGLFEQYNIRTCCMIFKKNYNKEIRYSYKGIDFVKVSKRKDIKHHIIQNRPRKVVFYGSSSFRLIHFIKKILRETKNNADILLDIQGALEERIEYTKGIERINNYIKYIIERKFLSYGINSVNGTFVVSDEMKEYIFSFLNEKNRNKFKIYKFRCGINSVISTEQKVQWRREIREQWGIDDITTVMVFSGYRMPWQNIDKIIKIFKKYDENMKNVFFAFFCNIDEKFEKQIEDIFPKGNYKLKFLSFDEYFKYLSACDVGFLIRDYNVTNKVAFPNKFSDYLNAGLMVTINKALPEPYRLLEKYNIEFIDPEIQNDKNTEKIINRQNDISKFYRTSERVCKDELLYSAQISKMKFIR